MVSRAVSTIARASVRRYLSRSGWSTQDFNGSPGSSGTAAPPVGFQNSATDADAQFQVARSYSLISPSQCRSASDPVVVTLRGGVIGARPDTLQCSMWPTAVVVGAGQARHMLGKEPLGPRVRDVSSWSPRARIACNQRCPRTTAPTACGCGHNEPWGLQWRRTTSPNCAVARPRSPTARSVRPSGNAGNSQIMGRPETWKVRSSGFGSPQRLRDRRWPSLLLASWTSNGAEGRRRAPVSASPRGDEALRRGCCGC
jgi:hypothetical protein